jgi:hypothetical protein
MDTLDVVTVPGRAETDSGTTPVPERPDGRGATCLCGRALRTCTGYGSRRCLRCDPYVSDDCG